MTGSTQPEFTALDLIHFDVSFALKKLQEQVTTRTFKRLLICTDRPFLNVSAATTYLETVTITNHSRLRDLLNKAETVLNLHNNDFEQLEHSDGDQHFNYSFETLNGGFLSINCAIECLYIYGKDIHYVLGHGDNYKEFALKNKFDLYSSKEFARTCNALINVITAFFTSDELHGNRTNLQPLTSMQTGHFISETEEIYLATLYDKVKANPPAGVNPIAIAQAMGLNIGDLPAFQYQLQESGYLKTLPGSSRITLTGAGMRTAQEISKNYQMTVATIQDGHALAMESQAVYRYIYYFRLSTQLENIYKSIIVGISDFVQMYDWKLSFAAGGSAERLLLLHARDKIISGIVASDLPDEQTFIIMQSDLPNLPKYKPADAPSMKGAEFYAFKRIRPHLPPPPTHRSVPDLIVETRAAINLVFRNKHKKDLLKLPQEENISDLHKGALSKEELNTRVGSLAATAGEMNVDLLRSITGETDTQMKTMMLLKKFLVPLDAAVEVHIDTLRSLVAIRNGYPAHKDKPETQQAYETLGLTFPVTDFSSAWQKLLHHYLTALQGLNQVIQQKYA